MLFEIDEDIREININRLDPEKITAGLLSIDDIEENNGLFEMKESFNEKTQWSGTQTLITPKGRETFRLLYLKTA